FFMGLSSTPLNSRVVWNILSISSVVRPFMPSRCFTLSWVRGMALCRFFYVDGVLSLFLLPLYQHPFVLQGINAYAGVVALYGQVAHAVAVHQCYQFHMARPAEGQHGVH